MTAVLSSFPTLIRNIGFSPLTLEHQVHGKPLALAQGGGGSGGSTGGGSGGGSGGGGSVKPVKPKPIKTEGNGKSAKSKYMIVAIYLASSVQYFNLINALPQPQASRVAPSRWITRTLGAERIGSSP